MQTTLRPTTNGTILVADDEAEVRGYFAMALRCHGFQVEFADDGYEVVDCLRNASSPVSALLLDVMMPRKDGMQALREIREFDRDLPIIMISGASSSVCVVEAMKSGATDFLAKPVAHGDLCKSLQKVLDGSWNRVSPAAPGPAATVQDGALFAGKTKHLESFLRKVAPTDAPVLILGETGTGKEVMARYMHAHSRRASKPFLKLNCAALPSELVESELFGYERGAFTGAFQKKLGMFELADGGTLLLDEIGDMDFKLQAKLLQVLQDQTLQHLGGRDTITVNVRMLAATHCDLERAIAERRFREDLYYRVSVTSVQVPPLRDRKDEIIPLAEFLMARHSAPGTGVLPLYPDLRKAMLDYPWPGNIRELENKMRQYLILADADALTRELRLKTLQMSGSTQRLVLSAPELHKRSSTSRILEQVRRAKDQAESEAILTALQSAGWNRKRAAGILGVDYKALLYKMKKLSIERSADTESAAAVAGKSVRGATFSTGGLEEPGDGIAGDYSSVAMPD
jgi:two-component system response regulator AtoC